MSDLIAVVQRLGEDRAFREAWLADPDGTLSGFDLTVAERDALRERDERLCAVLERFPLATQLPQIAFAVRLSPRVAASEAAVPQILHWQGCPPLHPGYSH